MAAQFPASKAVFRPPSDTNPDNSMASRRIYLDHNASAPLLDSARESLVEALGVTGNASSVHAEGRAVRAVIDKARQQVAEFSGVNAANVVFTSGATEAANMVLTPDFVFGRMPQRFSALYVGATEHPCVLAGGRFAPDAVTILPVGGDGILDLEVLASRLAAHDTGAGRALVAVQAANNESGVIQPLAEIAAIVKAHGGLLVVDAVQVAGRVPFAFTSDYGDFFILSSHKMGGPRGVGALIAADAEKMPMPLIRGGGQEKGHRAGTEAVALIAGFGAAAADVSGRIARAGHLRELRDRLEAGLANIGGVTVHGAGAPRLPNTSFFTLAGVKAQTAVMAYDLAGIAVSAGSACSSGRVDASHVLQAMGGDSGLGAIRVSSGPENTAADIDAVLTVTAQLVARHGGTSAAA